MSSPQTAGDKPVQSVYQRVTDMVLVELAAGTAPWRKPWRAEFGLPRNLDSRKPYRGVNILMLMSSALAAGYPANWWLTFQQAKEHGGHVNRGEHGYPIIFYRKLLLDADGESVAEVEAGASATGMKWRPVLKTFTVFNVAQCAGVPVPEPEAPPLSVEPVAAAEQIVEAIGVPVRYQGVKAFYEPQRDLITLPPRTTFESTQGFYRTLLHELVHATGHQKRLGRPYGRFGSEVYAWEELIAEMGSAMLAVITGVPCPDFPNIAAYIDSWRARLVSDARAICEAAAAAQKAVECLLTAAGLPLPQ